MARARPQPDWDRSTMSTLRTVGVIGAGQMGNGIAHVCALSGYDVLLNDADSAHINAGIDVIRGNLARQVHRETIKQSEMDAALARIKPAPKIAALAPCDL